MARKSSKISIDKSIADAVTWWTWVGDVELEQRAEETECKRFQLADGAWPPEVKAARAAGMGPAVPGYNQGMPLSARPMISIPSLDEPFALASAQERNAHLAPNIHALSEEASDATASILRELYRSIERDSHAGRVRSWAYDHSWWTGRGAYRVDKVYDPYGGHPFDQKLVLKRFLDQSCVRFDPHAQEPDWCDGLRAMVGVPIPWSRYKQKYPKSKIASFDDKMLGTLAETAELAGWVQGGTDETRTVTVAEDWRVEITQRKWVLLDDNTAAPEDDIPEGRKIKIGDDARWKYEEERKVFWRIINCCEPLEDEQEWDGIYIPLIPAIWRELQPFDGKRRWIGVVSNAKGPVRLTNYSASNAVMLAALEPNAPYELDPRQIEGYEQFWQQANIRNFPYLPHHQERNGVRFDAPKRTQVDVGRLGPSMQLLQMGKDFVQTATATHDPALGKQTPAFRSGRAIQALQDQTVQSTSGGLDNLAQVSLTYEAKVILDLIPRVYDRPERIARVLDEQNNSRLVMFNAPYEPSPVSKRPKALDYEHDDETGNVTLPPQTQQMVDDPMHPAQYINLSKGSYGVEVTIGKSYADRRQEGSAEMGQLLAADPALLPLIGPEYFKYRGEPWAEKVASILEKQREHSMPWLSDNQQQPNAQQIQQMQAELQQLRGMLGQAAQEKAGKVIELQGKAHIETIKETAETQRAHETNETKIAVATLSAKFETLANAMQLFFEERARLGTQQNDNAQAAHDRTHEAAMAQGDHEAATQQADQAHQHTLAQGQQGAVQDAALAEQAHGQNLEAVQAQPSQSDNGGGA